MALQTKTISANASNGHHKFTLTVTEESTNYFNYSYVTFSFAISSIKNGYDWAYSSNVPVTYSINVGGHTYSSNIMNYDGKSNFTMMLAEERPIEHNIDGTKTIDCSFSVTSNYSYSFLPGSCSASAKMTLTPIPRGAELSYCSKFHDEQSPIVYFNNPTGDYATTLEIGIGTQEAGESVDIAYRAITNKTASSYTFNFTQAEKEILWSKFFNTSSVATAYFKLRSVVNGQNFLSVLPVEVSLGNYKPIVTATVRETSDYIIGLTGVATRTIKGFNNLEVNVTATPQKGGRIDLYSVSNGGVVSNAQIATFTNVSSPTFDIRARDARGAVAVTEASIDMVDYFKPTINLEASAEMIGETTARVTLNISGKVFNASFGAKINSFMIRYAYKINGGDYEDWITVDKNTIAEGTKEYSANVTFDIDYKDTYTIKAVISDSITVGGTTSSETPVKIIPLFDWGRDNFNFNIPVSFQGDTMTDFIVEQGTASMGSNGTWYWSKWKSGKAECYGCRNFGNMAISTAWGNMFMSESFNQTLPSGLFMTSPDYIGITTNYGGFIIGSNSTPTSESNTGGFRVARGVSETASQVYIRFNIIGRWK